MMGRIFRFHEGYIEKIYQIKLRRGKSPSIARHECEMLRQLIRKYGKNTRGNQFKYDPRYAYLDLDGDSIQNQYDCQPLNYNKQDTKNFYSHHDFSTSFNMGDTSKYKVFTKYMTADEYLDLARQATIVPSLDGGKTTEEYSHSVLDQEKINRYAQAFKHGDKFPQPFLIYPKHGDVPQKHEGRHRTQGFKQAFGAKKKIPVYILRER